MKSSRYQVPCAPKLAGQVLRPDRQPINLTAFTALCRTKTTVLRCTSMPLTAPVVGYQTPTNGRRLIFFSRLFHLPRGPLAALNLFGPLLTVTKAFFFDFCLPTFFFCLHLSLFLLPPSSLFSQFLLSHKLLHPLFSHISSPLSPNLSPPSLYTRHLSLVFPLKAPCVCFFTGKSYLSQWKFAVPNDFEKFTT